MAYQRNQEFEIKFGTFVSIIFFSWMYTWEWDYIFDVLGIIMQNNIFWYLIVIAVGVSSINYFTFKKEVLIWEMILHIVSVFFITLITFYIFFDTSNLKDKAIFNSYASEIIYEEPYTEEYQVQVCSGSGDSQSCHMETRTRRVPEKNYIKTADNDTIRITHNEYNNFQFLYKNQYEEDKYRSSQTTYSRMKGEGDIWHIIPTKTHPTSNEHKVVNYIKVSKKTILKKGIKRSEKIYNNISKYPSTFNLGYGKIQFNRIITDTNSSFKSLKNINTKLNELLSHQGKRLEVNIILYLTNNKSKSFPKYVEKKWITWKKNDVIIFIDAKKNGEINWVKVEAFTKNSLFKIQLRDNIYKIKQWDDKKVYEVIKKQLFVKKNAPNSFVRTSMEEYRYLINEVEISTTWWFIFIFITLSFNFGISYFVRNNGFRK